MCEKQGGEKKCSRLLTAVRVRIGCEKEDRKENAAWFYTVMRIRRQRIASLRDERCFRGRMVHRLKLSVRWKQLGLRGREEKERNVRRIALRSRRLEGQRSSLACRKNCMVTCFKLKQAKPSQSHSRLSPFSTTKNLVY